MTPAAMRATRALQKAKKCEDCGGNGWLLFADHEIQRCDQCQKFDGDLEAATAYFKQARPKYWLDRILLRPFSREAQITTESRAGVRESKQRSRKMTSKQIREAIRKNQR